MNITNTPNGGKYALNPENREMIIENLSTMLDQLDDYRLQVVSSFVKRIAEGGNGND